MQFDFWTDPGPLHSLLPYIDIHDLDLKVQDLMVGGEWDLGRLYTAILNHLMTFLKDSKTILNPAVKDLFIWSQSPNGCYTTKSGFQWLLQQRGAIISEVPWN